VHNADLERLAQVALNIVCLRYELAGIEGDRLSVLSQAILVAVQNRGIAALADYPG